MLLTKTIPGLLYGITPTDPSVVGGDFAALIRTHRAATVDPTAAFRCE
jgi:hypothetical protein